MIQTVRLQLPALHDAQKAFVLDQHRFAIAAAGTKWGKCLHVETPIPVLGGWKTLHEIAVGDVLLNERGKPVPVTYVAPVQVGKRCYRVSFTDGHSLIADTEHLWTVAWQHNWFTLTTEQLLQLGISSARDDSQGRYHWRLPDVSLAEAPRFITQIQRVESVPVKCLEVDNPSHLFLAGRGLIPTHNTFGLCEWLTLNAWNREGCLAWWCAPIYRQAKIAYNLIGSFLPRERVRTSRTDLLYELLRSDGSVRSRIEFRSADRPGSLRGEGVHALVIDEAGFWSYDSFVSAMTTVTRTRGQVRVISTPKGRTWFYDLWLRGWGENQKDWPEYKSYQFPTSANPHVPRESIEEARRLFPDALFRQEWLAEFLDESAGVFKNIRGCATATLLTKPQPNRAYVMGIDWAKHEDFTVFMIADRERHEVVYIERFTGVDWNQQVDRAIRLAKAWNNAAVLMDSTGVGDVPLDSMKAVYPHVQGYLISNNQAKVVLIQKLQFALERGEIKYPNDPVLLHELEMYGFTMSSTGKFIFGAPEGYQDDQVIALALVNWQLSQEPLVYRFRSVKGI